MFEAALAECDGVLPPAVDSRAGRPPSDKTGFDSESIEGRLTFDHTPQEIELSAVGEIPQRSILRERSRQAGSLTL